VVGVAAVPVADQVEVDGPAETGLGARIYLLVVKGELADELNLF
jgi:hypothetical protein